MPDPITTETVLVNFTTDVSDIETAADVLQRTGKIDAQLAAQFKRATAEINNQQKAINNTAKAMQDATKKEIVSIEQVRAEMEQFVTDFIAGFQEGVIETLKEAGIEFDEFGKIINKNTDTVQKKSSGLKGELRSLREQMAQLKLEGKATGEEYLTMARRVGEIQDALGDAAQEGRNFASDTAKIDGLIDIARGVAGGFALIQGSVALFGDESEELQETLLKVNAAMAILQGLQEVGNVLQAESAAATFLQTTAQKAYNVVVGQSVGLMKAFRIALALTGVGLFIVLVTELVSAFSSANDELADLNDRLKFNRELTEANAKSFEALTERQIALAEEAGARESELIRLRGQGINTQIQALQEINDEYSAQMALLDNTSKEYDQLNNAINENNQAINTLNQQATAQRLKLNIQLRKEELQGISDAADARLAGARKNTAQELALAKQAARARAAVELNEAGQNLQQRLLIEANLQKQLRELDLGFAKVRQQDRIEALQTSLLKEQAASREINARVSQEEIDIQKRIIQESARLELLQDGLTAKQRLRIQQEALNQQAELQRNFNQQTRQEVIEDFISLNNAQLQQIELSNEERLRLSEENIIAQAEIEIQANQGISAKIKEITAKRDADIKALRLANIEATLQRELELETARTGTLRRAQERIVANERATLQQRIAAVNQLATLDIKSINARQDANDESLNKQLISYDKWLLEYEKLKDEESKITEDAELKKRQLYVETQREQIDIAINVAGQILDIVQQAGQQQLEAQQQNIDAQRAQVDDLLETGAITEREAERRQKRLDVEEKRLRRQQAQREKDFATFKALLAIPQAFLQGLTQGGPVLGAIYAGIAAAQAILIASRQIPKFGKGKNNDYEGPAELGETGAELWQTDSGIRYVPKRTIVWVNKKDKVFNPAQTRAMLERPSMRVKKFQHQGEYANNQNFELDYDKLGKAVGRNIPKFGLNIDKDGLVEWTMGTNSLTRYLDVRRSYK